MDKKSGVLPTPDIFILYRSVQYTLRQPIRAATSHRGEGASLEMFIHYYLLFIVLKPDTHIDSIKE